MTRVYMPIALMTAEKYKDVKKITASAVAVTV